MKKTIILAAFMALCCGLQAQKYTMNITLADDSLLTGHQNEIEFLDNGLLAIPRYVYDEEQDTYLYRIDTLHASNLKAVDLLTVGGRLWELDYAAQTQPNNTRADDFGYGSVLHTRDMLTEDMTTYNSTYNWFSAPLEIDMRPNYACTYINWFFYVEAIMQCNDIIRAIPADKATDGQKAILAEALTTRAMLYLDFARMYEFLPNKIATGQTTKGVNVNGLTVPIIDENTKATGRGYYVPRASKTDMVAFIWQDLARAEALMPFVTDPSHEIPHIDVIHGLRARLALWNGDYAEAANSAALAIQLANSRPMTTDQMLSTTNGFNDLRCWMWGVQQTTQKNQNGFYANFTSWMSPEFWGYAELVPPMIGRSLYDRIDDADPRKLLFVAPGNSPLYGQTPLISESQGFDTYTAVKFRPADGNTESGYDAAYPLMRVEEMYFIQAEATASFNPSLARRLLTDFMQQYRYASYTCDSTNLSRIVDEIILQKRIELWGEGQTFFDVKRLGLSVTRDYEGTNFYAAAAFNTDGRPYWMNMRMPSNAATKNAALYGYENPWEDTTEQPALNYALSLIPPAYFKNHDALPIDSVAYLEFSATLPDSLDSSGTSILELSLASDFPLGQTMQLANFYPADAAAFRVSAEDLCNRTKTLLTANGRPVSGRATAYLRILLNNAFSPAVAIPLLLPETDYMGYSYKFSFAPKVTATTVGMLDCEALAGEDSVKVVNLSLHGEGEIYTKDGYKPYLRFADGRDGFNLNADGYCNNTDESFNSSTLFAYNYVLNQSAESYTFGDGYAYGYTCRDGLVFGFSTGADSVAVSLKFNQQQIAEEKHSWSFVDDVPLTSTFLPELNGREVTLQRANDDETLLRLVAPYQRGHNLLLTSTTDSTLVLQRQMVSYDATQGPVYIQGYGTYADGVLKLSATFSDAAGKASTAEEQFGYQWKPIGTGTYTYNILDEGAEPGYIFLQRSEKEYGIADWYFGVTFTFYWNKADNTCTVPAQPTGYTHKTYGPIYVSDLNAYYSVEDHPSYYDPETQTFTFTLIYYVDAGHFGYGAETFQVEFDNNGTATRITPKSRSLPQSRTLLPHPLRLKNSDGIRQMIKD